MNKKKSYIDFVIYLVANGSFNTDFMSVEYSLVFLESGTRVVNYHSVFLRTSTFPKEVYFFECNLLVPISHL